MSDGRSIPAPACDGRRLTRRRRRSPPSIWFRTGGPAEWLVRAGRASPISRDFLAGLDPGGAGACRVGRRLQPDRPRRRRARRGGAAGKAFATVAVEPGNRSARGGGAMRHHRRLHGARRRHRRPRIPARIPGTVGGFVRMNAGAYGREVDGHPGRGDARAARRPASRPGRASGSATPTATANCPTARRRRGACSRACPASPPRSPPRWTGSPPSARPRSLCARAPAARPSRTRPAPRPGS